MFMPNRLCIGVKTSVLQDKAQIKGHTEINISGRKTNCQDKTLVNEQVNVDKQTALTVIQLRRFMLLFVEVDLCASAIEVRLNSCPS